jgi:allantoin racemase
VKQILLIAPFVQEGYDDTSHLQGLIPDSIRLTGDTIDFGPPWVESSVESGLAVPGTVAKIIQAEQDGIDAVIINCMSDTAVNEARACVTIPVLGPFETCMHLACQLGVKYSFITMVDEVIQDMENRATLSGMADQLASIRSIQMPCAEMLAEPEERHRRLIKSAKLAIREDGAGVIVFGCTEMAGSGEPVRTGLLESGLDVPVIDPIPASVHMATMLLNLGLSHSKACFSGPDRLEFIGHEFPST